MGTVKLSSSISFFFNFLSMFMSGRSSANIATKAVRTAIHIFVNKTATKKALMKNVREPSKVLFPTILCFPKLVPTRVEILSDTAMIEHETIAIVKGNKRSTRPQEK